MLYVIPFVILLVVLIILKKRESANQEQGAEKSKKTNLKKSNKKTSARSGRSSTASTASTAPSLSNETARKTLDPELKQSIESLIQAENYFSAEAKINQALNQDNSQHELYLYLLDVHLRQKDEFAIKQLINYLRSLGLHDIADQADEKYRLSQQTPTEHPEPTQQISSTPSASIAREPQAGSTAAFDALMDLNTDTSTFDQLQQDAVEKNQDYDAIEYTVEKKPITEEVTPLDFKLDAETPAQPYEEVSESTVSANETQTEVQIESAPLIEIEPLEFEFTQKPAAEQKTTLAEDFIFETPTHPAPVENKEHEFTLDFDVEKKSQPEAVVLDPVPEFTFSLETPISADPQALTFETPAFDAALNHAPVADEPDLSHAHDPLAQSFPELLKVNEIQLNLDLAARYIELGAYESAKYLLSQNEAEYSDEQRDRSQKLLNQIAS